MSTNTGAAVITTTGRTITVVARDHDPPRTGSSDTAW
jgi:hypothetical protein